MIKREPYMLAEGMAKGMRVLLHVCCAPCSCDILEGLKESGLAPTVFFYNPNIHPRDEYERRKTEVVRFSQQRGIPFVDADYDVASWIDRVKGLENEPERGRRCSVCFSMRLECAALYAQENDFPFMATSLSISRYKNQAQVHQAGQAAVARHNTVRFWNYDWRQKGGSMRGDAMAKAEGFYRQNYCGCKYSIRDHGSIS